MHLLPIGAFTALPLPPGGSSLWQFATDVRLAIALDWMAVLIL